MQSARVLGMGRRQRSARKFLGRMILSATIAASAGIPLRVTAQTEPRVRVTTRLVSLNVVVTDRHGRPVRGLTKDDFMIRDGGRAQKISYFSVESGEEPPAPAKLPNNTFTNVLAQRGKTPHSVVVILFDALNTQWKSQAFSLNRLRTMLRQLRPEDHVGLYVLGDQLKVLHDFTQDSSELIAAIRRYDARHAAAKASLPASAPRADTALDLFLTGNYNTYQFYRERENRVVREQGGFLDPPSRGTGRQIRANQISTQAALQEIRGHMAGVAGRKSVVWITDTLSDDGALITNPMHSIPSEYELNLDYIARQFNDVGISIYPVSAEGLIPVPVRWEPGGFVQDYGPIEEGNMQHLSMQDLAKNTGGRAIYDRNDVETGALRALEDARFSYSLAYYPDNLTSKAEFRALKVVVRVPGANILARKGYYAKPERYYAGNYPTSVRLSDQARIRLMRQLAESPLDATAVPITAELSLIGDKNPRDVEARVTCDPASLVSFTDAGRWRGELDVMYIELDGRNTVLDATHDEVKLDFSPDEFQSVANSGVRFEEKLPSFASAAMLTIIVRDTASGTVGSLHIPLTHAEPVN